MSEQYLGIVLWADRDGSRCCIADLAGQTWIARDRAEVNREWIEVYQGGWRPTVHITQNPRTGKDFMVAEPQLVQFSIAFFNYRDGRDGYQIQSIEPAQNIQQQDSDSLFIVREEWETQKSAERRKRIEIGEENRK